MRRPRRVSPEEYRRRQARQHRTAMRDRRKLLSLPDVKHLASRREPYDTPWYVDLVRCERPRLYLVLETYGGALEWEAYLSKREALASYRGSASPKKLPPAVRAVLHREIDFDLGVLCSPARARG